jgi:hypothetical protein
VPARPQTAARSEPAMRRVRVNSLSAKVISSGQLLKGRVKAPVEVRTAGFNWLPFRKP